ncbi:hypothetical protein A9Q81_12620 [Gammaproteobacteria bacterium 42_54_T18]|nr:hypothetical protein A9Q81_12620 [Gammaproteobacteria bacterium 42_54_T18]
MDPTSELYESLQKAFDHFNRSLFQGKLPNVIFTVQRKKGVMGYFAPDRWGNLGGKRCHEIAINPSYIANSRLIEVMQTLVHEMVHSWQFCFGSPGRDYYHNKEWAHKMIKIGLMPSTTGEPGGAITGQQMGDYIVEGGRFLVAFNDLKDIEKFQLSWIDRRALPRLFEPIVASLEENGKGSTGYSLQDSKDIVAGNPKLAEPEGGPFPTHFIEPTDFSYSEIMPDTFIVDEAPPRKTRYRYICYGCNSKVYGRPRLNIRCDDCNQVFECEKV